MIRELVASGRHSSAAEGLALLRERELARQATQAWLKVEIQKGVDEADRGETIPMEEVLASVRAEIAAKANG